MEASHLPQVLEVERRAYPFPWTETIFKDCLRAGYSAWVFIADDGVIGGNALMSLAVDETLVVNPCVDPAYTPAG